VLPKGWPEQKVSIKVAVIAGHCEIDEHTHLSLDVRLGQNLAVPALTTPACAWTEWPLVFSAELSPHSFGAAGLFLFIEPGRYTYPVEAEVSSNSYRRQWIGSAASSLFVNPTLRDLQTLRQFGKRQDLVWINWDYDFSSCAPYLSDCRSLRNAHRNPLLTAARILLAYYIYSTLRSGILRGGASSGKSPHSRLTWRVRNSPPVVLPS